MDITIFLAQIWGPVILAVGIGVFTSRSYYLKVYRDLEKETLAVLLFAMFAIAVGTAQILIHNAWGTIPEAIISLLGWGLLIKGALFAIAPGYVDKSGNWWAARPNLFPIVGALTVLCGAYLIWFGFFA
jgi:hypothetical protein